MHANVIRRAHRCRGLWKELWKELWKGLWKGAVEGEGAEGEAYGRRQSIPPRVAINE